MQSIQQYVMTPVGSTSCTGIGRNSWDCIASAVVGPEGGIVAVTDRDSPIFGTTLRIPAGALETPTLISITKGGHSCDFAYSPSIQLEPSGLKFNRPVTLKVRLDNACTAGCGYPEQTPPAVYLYDESTDRWNHDGAARLDRRGNVVFCDLTQL